MKKLLGVMLLAGTSLFAAPHFSIGIGVGAPAVAAVQPPCPGPGYTWVDGYWAPGGSWTAGYWAAPGRVQIDRSWNHVREEHYDRGRGHFRR